MSSLSLRRRYSHLNRTNNSPSEQTTQKLSLKENQRVLKTTMQPSTHHDSVLNPHSARTTPKIVGGVGGLLSFLAISNYVLISTSSYMQSGLLMALLMVALCVGSISVWMPSGKAPFSKYYSMEKLKANFLRTNFSVLMTMLFFSIRFFLTTNKALMLPLGLFCIAGISRDEFLKDKDLKTFGITHVILCFCGIHFIGHDLYLASGIVSKYFTTELTLQQTFSALYQFIDETFPVTSSIWIFGFLMIMLNIQLYEEYEKLKFATAKWQDACDQLEKALQVKNKFMSSLSHEFRCPILSSLGSIELMKETEMTPEQREHVSTIETANSILLAFIEDILLFVKLEHENSQNDDNRFENKVVDSTYIVGKNKVFKLSDALSKIHKLIEPYAGIFKAKVVLNIHESLKDIFINCNESKLQQCFVNLLTNAIKASHENGIVEFNCDPIERNMVKHNSFDNIVSVESPQNSSMMNWIEIKVIDYGIGIPEDKKKEIFEPFTQLHNLNENVTPGSGLGLCTVKHVVKSLGGQIDLLSTPNKGSTFIIKLPVMESNEPPSVDTEKTIAIHPTVKRQLQIKQLYLDQFHHTHKQFKEHLGDSTDTPIIVAEDNAINRKVILNLVKSLGYNADAVCDGKELIEAFDPSRHKLVITDMHMPNMNGFEAASVLREKYGDKIKIIMLTADALTDFTTEKYVSVVDTVVCKPCTKQNLFEQIEKWMIHTIDEITD